MISLYDLQYDRWFDLLFGMRDKWCPGLSKDFCFPYWNIIFTEKWEY